MRVAHPCVETNKDKDAFYCSECDMTFVPGFADARGHGWNPTLANYVHHNKKNRGKWFLAKEDPY